MPQNAIEIEHLTKRYRRGIWAHSTMRSAIASSVRRLLQSGEVDSGWFEALSDVTLSIGEGESVALVGDNGAGKSTLLKVLSGITPPTAGRAVINGRVGSLLEVGSGFHPDLTGRDNIFLNGLLLGMSRRDVRARFDEIVDFSGVEAFIDTPVKRYSSGMYMRLAFAIAAHLDTEILFVDEVLAVGDVSFQQKCLDRMNQFSGSGRTIVFVSHNLTAVEALCGRSILIEKGRVAADGPTREVLNQYLRRQGGEATFDRVTFEPGQGPSRGRLEILAASVRPANGGIGEPIDVKTDIVFEFTIRRTGGEPSPVVAPSIIVTTSGGELLFTVGPLEPNVAWPAGTYLLRCHLPGNLLNNGRYSVGLYLGEDDLEPFTIPHLIDIDVLDNAEYRFGWYDEWPGLIRPRLEWERQRIDP